jgi:hypothetical protein
MRYLLLILSLVCLAPTAFAVELRGDWESAGDMPIPYEPKYDFEYDCQMELKGTQPYVAVTRFTLRNKETYFETGKSTRWEWVKFGQRNSAAAAPKDPGLQLEGHYASLTLWQGEEAAKDRVEFHLGWKMAWKEFEVTGLPYEFEFNRADTRLSGRFFVYLKKAKSSESRKSVEAQVYCDKVK